MDANLISFKAFIDSNGELGTETRRLPRGDIEKVFKGFDAKRVRTLLDTVERKIETLHRDIEDELNAINN
jgi:hypothetical protein